MFENEPISPTYLKSIKIELMFFSSDQFTQSIVTRFYQHYSDHDLQKKPKANNKNGEKLTFEEIVDLEPNTTTRNKLIFYIQSLLKNNDTPLDCELILKLKESLNKMKHCKKGLHNTRYYEKKNVDGALKRIDDLSPNTTFSEALENVSKMFPTKKKYSARKKIKKEPKPDKKMYLEYNEVNTKLENLLKTLISNEEEKINTQSTQELYLNSSAIFEDPDSSQIEYDKCWSAGRACLLNMLYQKEMPENFLDVANELFQKLQNIKKNSDPDNISKALSPFCFSMNHEDTRKELERTEENEHTNNFHLILKSNNFTNFSDIIRAKQFTQNNKFDKNSLNESNNGINYNNNNEDFDQVSTSDSNKFFRNELDNDGELNNWIYSPPLDRNLNFV